MRGLRKVYLAYGLLIPAFIVVGTFIVYPLYLAFRLSFLEGQTMNLTDISHTSFSMQNYITVLTDYKTWRSVWVSIVYTAVSTGGAFILGLVTALLLNKHFFGRRWFRTLILLPWAVPGVVAVLGFVWLLDASYGVVNYLLTSNGIVSENIEWFVDPNTAMIAVILPTVWKGYPFFTLMLLASLQSIPGDLYEAARVDGASATALFRWITWPGIKATSVLALVLNGLWVFREFDFIYPTTGGGPSGATETLAIKIYNEAFSFFHMGIASAIGIFTILLCVIVVLFTFPILKGEFFGGK